METEKSAQLREGAIFINGELSAVLAELSRSRGELRFPEAVTFSSGVKVDSFSEQNVEAVIRAGLEKGEIYFGVDPNFIGQAFSVRRFTDKNSEGRVIFALFPANFKQACDILLGMPVQRVLRDCLAKVIFEDQGIVAEKLPRGSYHSSETVGLVGIFRGKII